MSRRQLSDEERALWGGFARSIVPLPRTASAHKSSAKPRIGPSHSSEPLAPRLRPHPVVRHELVPTDSSNGLVPLGRRVRQRVARGRDPIDARIDLHGLTQIEAHAALLRFLHRAQEDGARIVLIVTGKGSGLGDAVTGRGVLRRQVPMWLALPQFRRLIIGFEDAHVSHGGQGALYVRLRRGA